MLAELVVFNSVVEFLIIAMYIGGVPVAEHDSLVPRNTRTSAGASITTLGETNEVKIEITKHCKYFLFNITCKHEFNYRPNFVLNSENKRPFPPSNYRVKYSVVKSPITAGA